MRRAVDAGCAVGWLGMAGWIAVVNAPEVWTRLVLAVTTGGCPGRDGVRGAAGAHLRHRVFHRGRRRHHCSDGVVMTDRAPRTPAGGTLED